MFLGSDHHGDVAVRKRLKAQCKEFAAQGPHLCRWESFSPSRLILKQQSVFCLEPGGDTPFRQSLSDSITFGCIPVFSMKQQTIPRISFGLHGAVCHAFPYQGTNLSTALSIYMSYSSQSPLPCWHQCSRLWQRMPRSFRYVSNKPY